MLEGALIPDWPAAASVGALMTSRSGGISGVPWQSLNLGVSVGDVAEHVGHLGKAVARDHCQTT